MGAGRPVGLAGTLGLCPGAVAPIRPLPGVLGRGASRGDRRHLQRPPLLSCTATFWTCLVTSSLGHPRCGWVSWEGRHLVRGCQRGSSPTSAAWGWGEDPLCSALPQPCTRVRSGNFRLLFSPHNANASGLTASIQNERKSGAPPSRTVPLGGRGAGRRGTVGQVRAHGGVLGLPTLPAGAPRPQRPAVREAEGLSCWRGGSKQVGEKDHAGGWRGSPGTTAAQAREEGAARGLQTGPGGLRLSQFCPRPSGHLLTLQGSEPSRPLSSKDLAAACSFSHSTNAHRELLCPRLYAKHWTQESGRGAAVSRGDTARSYRIPLMLSLRQAPPFLQPLERGTVHCLLVCVAPKALNFRRPPGRSLQP